VVSSVVSGIATSAALPGVTLKPWLNDVPGTVTVPVAAAVAVMASVNCGVPLEAASGNPSQKSVPALPLAAAVETAQLSAKHTPTKNVAPVLTLIDGKA
jgi:hypothetical protein